MVFKKLLTITPSISQPSYIGWASHTPSSVILEVHKFTKCMQVVSHKPEQ